jgi:hypothetical protein
MTFEIKPAAREAATILAAFIGQPGSGKTYSALLFARGLVGPDGKIVMIDTEGKRSLIYADDPDIGGFHHMDFVAPYSSDRFREAINEAVKAGADAVIIDSASHEHEAEGGMLDFADAEEHRMASRRDKSRAKWIKPKMAHNRFIRTAVSCPAHVIFCVREKRIVDMDSKPAKEIFVPVCDAALMYDLEMCIKLQADSHVAQFIKVPKPLLPYITEGEMISKAHGEALVQEFSKGEQIDRALQEELLHLENIAADGLDSLRTAWKAALESAPTAAWKKELNKHAERIKGIAEKADRISGSDSREEGNGTQ